MFAPAFFAESYFPKGYFPPASTTQPLHGRRRGRIIRDEVFEKLPDGLVKPPAPPPPDFGKTIQTPVNVFSDFESSKTNIVFKGLKDIPKPKKIILEEEEAEALALILSELD